jgi:DNA-directed RNA polymerase specialized sigma24 family protein
MDPVEELDRRGNALLAALAANPDDEDCSRQFDTLFYEAVWRYLRANHAVLATRVARYLGVRGAVAPQVLAEEVDEVAHDATATALRRVRRSAWKFDESKGRPTEWVIGAAEFAYIEVAKAVVVARRSDALTFLDPLDSNNELNRELDRNPTPEELVLRHLEDADALADAARHLSEKEFVALRLRATAGYSRGETAERIFGDETMKKQADGLVERGRRKLAEAWADRRPSPRAAGGANVPDPSADKEETDG